MLCVSDDGMNNKKGTQGEGGQNDLQEHQKKLIKRTPGALVKQIISTKILFSSQQVSGTDLDEEQNVTLH